MAVDKRPRSVEKALALPLEGSIPLLHGDRLDAELMILIIFQHHVVGDGHGRRKSHPQPVFGNKTHGDPLVRDLLGRKPYDGFPLVIDPARFDLAKPCDRLAQLALTASCDPRNAQNLAAADEKAQIFDRIAALVTLDGEIADLQKRAVERHRRALNVEHDLLPHHHLGQGDFIRLTRVDAADVFPLTEHRNAVGDRHDLVQLMRDDDDRLAVRLHGADHGKELVRLLRGEHRRRLVKNEDLGAAIQNLDDLHRLLFGDGHVVDLLFGVELEAVLFGDRADFLVDARRTVPLAVMHAENDILRRREDIDELEVLMHHADPETEGILRGGDDDLLSVHEDLPFIGIIDARDHVHQRRLAAAVFAEQRKDLPPFQGKIDALVRCNGTEILADMFEFKRELLVHLPPLNAILCKRTSGGENIFAGLFVAIRQSP